ncbi:MAG: Nif11-like leader peptide family RiPP precursor [Terrimicrobiaceae bacterium]|nr:Nif11-like leader peptide family RiPP precursor [Terrimicrobiaceae bacterium]
MKTDLEAFAQLAATDPAIQRELMADGNQSPVLAAERIAGVANSRGFQITPAEILAAAGAATGELAEYELEAVAGGAWGFNFRNLLLSGLTAGVGCGLVALISVGKGNADACAPSEHGKQPS